MTLVFLLIGFLFTFLIPGFLIIETFWQKLPPIQKLPLYLLLSVLVSTHLVYAVSLGLGFSKTSTLFSLALFFPWLVYVLKRKLKYRFPLRHSGGLLLGLAATLVFLLVLDPAIFRKYQNYIVMGGSNWQDTAMHLGIIQSISQGNFPPQAPYYSGVPLAYYYYTDLHTAILTVLVGGFVPRLLVFDNPFFVLTFTLALYALGYYLTKSRLSAWLATYLGLFGGSFMFIRLAGDLKAVIAKGNAQPVIKVVKELLERGYTMEYGQLIRMVPITDYFLQNRPMMVGLPAGVLVSLLVLEGLGEREPRRLLLAGLMAGMVIKFQLFAFGVSLVVFGLAWTVYLKRENLRRHLDLAGMFLLPAILFLLPVIFSRPVNNRSLLSLVRINFSFGPWGQNQSLGWHAKFIPANFGLPFMIAAPAFVIYVVQRKRWVPKATFLFCWLAVMLIIPYLVRFTIYGGDMFKFYYFMMIPVAVIAGYILGRGWQVKTGPILILLVLLISSLTSFLTLAYSFLNKNYAYSLDDYRIGLWIRQQTPPRAVFAGLPTVHTPITQIGGRLRVLAYINWPYSHGFNHGPDNVFNRLGELKSLYQDPANRQNLFRVMEKYQARYLYYGPEEKDKYPHAGPILAANPDLSQVYQSRKVQIYEYRPTGQL